MQTSGESISMYEENRPHLPGHQNTWWVSQSGKTRDVICAHGLWLGKWLAELTNFSLDMVRMNEKAESNRRLLVNIFDDFMIAS